MSKDTFSLTRDGYVTRGARLWHQWPQDDAVHTPVRTLTLTEPDILRALNTLVGDEGLQRRPPPERVGPKLREGRGRSQRFDPQTQVSIQALLDKLT